MTALDAPSVARWRALCLVLLGAFLGMSLVVGTVGLLPGDVPLHQEILKGRGTLLHVVARWVDYGGKWVVLAPAMALLLIWSHAARRHWWLWCALMPIGGAVEQSFKFLVGRPRPRGVNWGFPSGHVTAAATFAVILLYIMTRERLSPAARTALTVLAVAPGRLGGLRPRHPRTPTGRRTCWAACCSARAAPPRGPGGTRGIRDRAAARGHAR